MKVCKFGRTQVESSGGFLSECVCFEVREIVVLPWTVKRQRQTVEKGERPTDAEGCRGGAPSVCDRSKRLDGGIVKRREFMTGSMAVLRRLWRGRRSWWRRVRRHRGGSFMSCGGITCSRGRRLS